MIIQSLLKLLLLLLLLLLFGFYLFHALQTSLVRSVSVFDNLNLRNERTLLSVHVVHNKTFLSCFDWSMAQPLDNRGHPFLLHVFYVMVSVNSFLL